MLTALDSPTLMKLASQGLTLFFHHAEGLRSRLDPAASMILSGEPYLDLNVMVFESPHPDAARRLESYITEAGILTGGSGGAGAQRKEGGLPYIAMFAPEVADELGPIAEKLGLDRSDSIPVMTCEGTDFQVTTSLDVTVNRVADQRDWLDYASPMAAALNIPEKSIHRVFPETLATFPGVDLYLARDTGGAAVGAVSLTSHGSVCGIWGMAVHPDHQRKGIGRVLLTHAMDEQHRIRHTAAFFLCSTPAGLKLYERIGFKTIVDAPGWKKA